jgi:UrcA family protein
MAGDTATESNQVAVRYGDLKLQIAAGQEALKRRVSSAARCVCPNPYSADLVTRVTGKRCGRIQGGFSAAA